MKKLLLFTLLLSSILTAQSIELQRGLDAINKSALEGQLEFLASDWMEGRDTGSKGIFLAADYIKSIFKLNGIEPAGDLKTKMPTWQEMQAGKEPVKYHSYFQNFSMIEYQSTENQILTIESKSGGKAMTYNLKYKTDFSVNTSDVGQEITSDIVFVGYGLTKKDNDYDDYRGIDVKGKIVLRLAGFPGHKDTSSEAYKKFHPKGRWGKWMLMRQKDEYASENGAIAVIEFDPDMDPAQSWVEKNPKRVNLDYYEGTEELRDRSKRIVLPGKNFSDRLTVISVSERAANLLLDKSKIDLDAFEKNAQENLETDSKVISGKSLSLVTDVNSKRLHTKNILGFIEGENPDEVVVIGAHYDHVGMDKGYIWNGSDDNGSGTVGVMTIAKAFKATGIKPKKSILFALWTGEEKGLFGSKYFVDNPVIPIENIVCNINLDMLSRNSDEDSAGVKCEVIYTSTAPLLKELTEKHNNEYNFGFDFNFEGYVKPGGGSDHANFADKDIPVMFFFSGFHPDYHGIGDHADKADYTKMEKIVKTAFLNAWKIANMEGPIPKVEASTEEKSEEK